MQWGNLSEVAEGDLIKGLQNGEVLYFEKIYAKYSSRLYTSAYNILRNKQVCEDIVQELFIELWVKREKLQIQNLKSYLYTAVRNKVLMTIRSGKVVLDLEVVEMLVSEYDADNGVLQKELQENLEKGISELPEKCREVFVLSRKQQLSHKEIANLLNISVKTVENHLTIALRRLRASMADFLLLVISMLPLFL
ncbi:RNA polymerase sigma-70 factor [Desertivirga brevis]|uniref:RNA polymerase sigma-70 factor n=1 Tax=Desertivirga brevis TaxID=2810310 RepID=UPI001A9725EF|nr:RNA polymerase sigma-70 factor [Pedobacter sp. SYSU D00873]